ncbi:hypothetical protein P4114_30095 [Pseudomonas aeruginosa]|nr:hypothetical protein [Pseudomonas aeruginosa]
MLTLMALGGALVFMGALEALGAASSCAGQGERFGRPAARAISHAAS